MKLVLYFLSPEHHLHKSNVQNYMSFARLRLDYFPIQGTLSLKEPRIKMHSHHEIKFDATSRKLLKMHAAPNTHNSAAKSTETAAKHASIHTAKPPEQPWTVLRRSVRAVLTERRATTEPRDARIGGGAAQSQKLEN